MLTLIDKIFYFLIPLLVVLHVIIYFLSKKTDKEQAKNLKERLDRIKEKMKDV